MHSEYQEGYWSAAFVRSGLILVYFAPKTLTEVVAAHILVVAAFLAQADVKSRARLGFIGALLGLAFCLRFHLSLALFAVALWACCWTWLSGAHRFSRS